MLTKEELAHYELAARMYCTRTGVDPESRMPRPHPTIKGVIESVRVWHMAAEELHDLSMKLTALRDAALQKQESGELPGKIVLDS